VTHRLPIWDWVYDKESADNELLFEFEIGYAISTGFDSLYYQFNSNTGELNLNLDQIIDHFTLYITAIDDSNATACDSIQLILTTINSLSDRTPKIFELTQNFPNPFNRSTTIHFSLPTSEKVKIELFNFLGQKVATILNQQLQIGFHRVVFNAKNLPSGIYTYKITAGPFQDVKKMLYLK
jgi:hypothetical protein